MTCDQPPLRGMSGCYAAEPDSGMSELFGAWRIMDGYAN